MSATNQSGCPAHEATAAKFLARSSVLSIAAQVASVACSSLLGIFLARVLGPAGYGDFTYAYTLLLIAVIPAKRGLDTAAMKLIAAYEHKNDLARINGFLRYSLWHITTSGMAVSAAGALTLYLLGNNIPPTLSATLWVTIPCIFVLSALHVSQYFLYGLRRYVLALLPESIVRPLSLILCITLMLSFSAPVSAAFTMLINFGLTCLLLAFTLFVVLRLLPPDTIRSAPIYEKAEWTKTGNSMLMISGLNFLLNQTDIVLLGLFAGTYEAGQYAAASRIALLSIFFYSAINSVAAPLIARHYAAGQLADLTYVTKIAARAIVCLTSMLTVISVVFGRQLLWLFGETFMQAYPVLVVLSFAQLFKALSGLGGFMLTMTAHEGTSARLSFISAISNLLLATLTIPYFGALGAACSTLLATVLWSVAVIVVVKRRIGINCSF